MGGKQGRIYVLDAPTMTLRQDKSAPGEQPPDWALAGVNPAHIGEGQAFHNQHMDTGSTNAARSGQLRQRRTLGLQHPRKPVYWLAPAASTTWRKDHLKVT
jgi:hypothetical protein